MRRKDFVSYVPLIMPHSIWCFEQNFPDWKKKKLLFKVLSLLGLIGLFSLFLSTPALAYQIVNCGVKLMIFMRESLACAQSV